MLKKRLAEAWRASNRTMQQAATDAGVSLSGFRRALVGGEKRHTTTLQKFVRWINKQRPRA